MKLNLDSLGNIPATYPAKFFRVSNYATGARVADFSGVTEAREFAIIDSGAGNWDHKVSAMFMTAA